jgi:hypothetical protein
MQYKEQHKGAKTSKVAHLIDGQGQAKARRFLQQKKF